MDEGTISLTGVTQAFVSGKPLCCRRSLEALENSAVLVGQVEPPQPHHRIQVNKLEIFSGLAVELFNIRPYIVTAELHVRRINAT